MEEKNSVKKGVLQLDGTEMVGGKEVSEIKYDFTKLKGKDVAAIKMEMASDKKAAVMVETDTDFHAYLFAAAAGIAVEDVYNMSIGNYFECIGTARNFILL